jgi:hypothetical protein
MNASPLSRLDLSFKMINWTQSEGSDCGII